MSLIRNLEKEIKTSINNIGYEIDSISLLSSNRKDLGQFQINESFKLAKKYKKNPLDIANDIANELNKNNKFIDVSVAQPAFINITLSNSYLTEIINEVDKDINLLIDKKEEKKIIIDYGGANVAKALHVGHLRSANIGEALKRLAKLQGYNIIGDAHLGDYGRPLGLVIKEIKERYPNLEYFDPSYKGSYENISLPITNIDLETIYPIASQKAKEDEAYLSDARNITTKLQQHERGYYDLWKKIVEISKKDIKKIYDLLDVDFEIWNGEADAMEYFDELIEILNSKNLIEESENAKIVDVKEENDKEPMPPLMLIKSNDSISYASTDLACILEREKKYNPDEIWYVVDSRQSLHFKQVFRTIRKTNILKENQLLEHIGFGTINGPDGKPFKTRDGSAMSLEKLIDLTKKATFDKITNTNLTKEEKESISQTVAIAALKYADLTPYRETDYIFEVEKFTNLEGKTGPYLLYSTIRIKSLLEKSDINNTKSINIYTDTEKDIAKTILTLTNILDKSLNDKSLNEITDYLYNLNSLYNKFYSENKILTEEDYNKKISWLTLSRVVKKINELLLSILAIKIPNKM